MTHPNSFWLCLWPASYSGLARESEKNPALITNAVIENQPLQRRLRYARTQQAYLYGAQSRQVTSWHVVPVCPPRLNRFDNPTTNGRTAKMRAGICRWVMAHRCVGARLPTQIRILLNKAARRLRPNVVLNRSDRRLLRPGYANGRNCRVIDVKLPSAAAYF